MLPVFSFEIQEHKHAISVASVTREEAAKVFLEK